jgi:hypothetical protein
MRDPVVGVQIKFNRRWKKLGFPWFGLPKRFYSCNLVVNRD